MERFNEVAVRDACIVQWQAEALAGVYLPRKSGDLVPPRWTAWLLMEKAGVPRDLVAYVCHVEPRQIHKHVRFAKVFMLYAPYAARIEELSEAITPFGAPHVPATRPAREALCPARVG